MTKKEFKELASVHMYGKRSNGGMIAIYFDWKEGDIDGKMFVGFKYAIFTRQENMTQAELLRLFYDMIVDYDYDKLPYYVTFINVNDEHRFKVPIVTSGLNKLYIHNQAKFN